MCLYVEEDTENYPELITCTFPQLKKLKSLFSLTSLHCFVRSHCSNRKTLVCKGQIFSIKKWFFFLQTDSTLPARMNQQADKVSEQLCWTRCCTRLNFIYIALYTKSSWSKELCSKQRGKKKQNKRGKQTQEKKTERAFDTSLPEKEGDTKQTRKLINY